jgi:hypothetical protein
MATLTDKERELLTAIADGMDQPGCGWLHEVTPFQNDHVTAGVLGSLIRKGLAHSHEDDEVTPGYPPAFWVELTPAGEAAMAELEPAPAADPEAEAAVAHLCRKFPVATAATYQPAVLALRARGAEVTPRAILQELERPRPVLPGETLPPAPPAWQGPAPELPRLSSPAELRAEADAMAAEAVAMLAAIPACPGSAPDTRSAAAQLTRQAEDWRREAARREAAAGPELPELPSRFRPWPPAGLEPWGNVPI